VLQNGFGHRRAADISKTDEQDLDHVVFAFTEQTLR
jgi:hypothetical protein